MDITAWMRQEPGGRWVVNTGGEPSIRATGSTRDRCVAGLRRALARWLEAQPSRAGIPNEPLIVVVEVKPVLAGVAEAADVMRWDKRRVVTYIDRGRFPEPVQSLASGRIWDRDEVERFARDWRARRDRRRRPRS